MSTKLMWLSTSVQNRILILLLVAVLLSIACEAFAQNSTPSRRISPVDNASARAVNELANDTAFINQARRQRSVHYHDKEGRAVYVDTITGEEWVDSLSLPKVVKMNYPLWQSVAVGVDIWDPALRLFGQKYGLVGFSAQLNMHNRYMPILEIGLGRASNTPAGMNFTYKSPLSVYFKVGADYNFLYNSNPDYLFFAGLRYGFAPFSYQLTDISIEDTYWDQTMYPTIPSQKATVGWAEFVLGLKVKLWGPIAAGWSIRYHGILHQSRQSYGDPWYIPGYGTYSGSITGSFSIYYTLPLNRGNKKSVDTNEQNIDI